MGGYSDGGTGGDHSFHIADYAVFGATLVISLGIGVYQALSGGKQRTISEYLVGGRKMTVLPVAISLMVSFESSIMMLGMPGEAYVYGIQYLIGSLGYMCSQLICIYLVVPVVYPLRLTSAYEYLELRFKSKIVRKIGSILGILNYVWYMGVVLYGPATALEAVTGFSQWNSIFLVAGAAIIYTSIGGLKAVIWTDVFQAFIMFAGMFAVLIKGTIDVGGPSEVWRRANEGGRNNLFTFDPDPTVRHSFWSLFFGKLMRGMSMIFNQSSIQRISSTGSLKEAMTVMILVAPGFLLTFILAIMEGIVAYSYYDYNQCDPFQSQQIKNPNQVVPLMVVDVFRQLPGMPGLFLAALFSASLSTISSGLSSISALTWKDFVQPLYPNMGDFKATLVAKFSVVVFGFVACGVSLLAAMVGGPLTQIGTSLLSSFGGTLAGLFLLGSMSTIANEKGAICGSLVGFILTSWISMGANFSPKRRKTPWLPAASTERCWVPLNSTLVNVTESMYTHTTQAYTTTESLVDIEPQLEGVEKMYLLSYVWFSSVAIIAVVVVGLAVSYATYSEKDRVDPKYIVPLWRIVRGFLPTCMKCKIEEEDEPEEKERNAIDNVFDTELIINCEETKLPLDSNGIGEESKALSAEVDDEISTPGTDSDVPDGQRPNCDGHASGQGIAVDKTGEPKPEGKIEDELELDTHSITQDGDDDAERPKTFSMKYTIFIEGGKETLPEGKGEENTTSMRYGDTVHMQDEEGLDEEEPGKATLDEAEGESTHLLKSDKRDSAHMLKSGDRDSAHLSDEEGEREERGEKEYVAVPISDSDAVADPEDDERSEILTKAVSEENIQNGI